MKKTILFGVACFAVLLAGCLPQEKLTGRVIDTTGPVSGAAVLGMVWVEDAAKIKPAPEVKNLLLEERDTALNADMKTRGLPTAYARGFADKNGWFRLEKLHFSAETTRAIKAMKEPRITRVTVWAFQRGYRKQAVTTFLKDTAQEIPAATLLLFKPVDWKELYRDNTVDSLTRDYMVKGYSKAFGATETEKDWILEYTHSNLWQAYVESDIKGDKEMEEMCGRDYSDLVVSDEGIYRNPAHERCAELKQRMGAVRDIEELWIAHAKRSEDPLAAAKEVVRRAIALLPAEAAEPKEYESMILAGIEDAANALSKGAISGTPNTSWEERAKLHYGRGDKAAAYRVLGSSIYHQLPEEIKQGALTAQVSIRTVPGIRETAAGFYLLMNRPLTAQLPGGDNGGNGGKTKASTDTAKEEGIPIEEYVPKVIIEGKWGTGPGEFGRWGELRAGEMSDYCPSSLAVDSMGYIYVLDVVNERIQKFNPQGRFLKSIPVASFSGKRYEAESIFMVDADNENINVSPNHPRRRDVKKKFIKIEPDFESVGINIVIDSKDTLYCYLKRIKDGKETGEVWEFKKDKLVGKAPQKLQPEPSIPLAKYVDTKIDADVKEENINRRYGAIDHKKRELKFHLNADEELYGKRKVFFDESTGEWNVRIKKNGKVWYKKYDSASKLLSISEVPVLSEFADSKGSYYFLETAEHGMKIRKNELIRTLK